ncbi:LysR family transcriptional regulator [Acidovorax sp. CCYZU-2555]|uniref:LysR family transcriptional regulator n=1 Tax=Acidovorax sp. CCYZU-2555 TaxID=2835042 RepID=UPI001BD01442|nr:LysR family transcriptional regulator [Acidovorax sp. CCYZU-2555]MBS7781512.1 LysR family transcriptional regulator [Acidovorax sp. CCYZU-2555]
MENLGSIGIFVRVAERLGFSVVARDLGVSPSAVGKAVARLEERLGVRLFHRSTRTLALTAEGEKFLERCRRILCEIEAAELEMTQASAAPRGKLRVSLPRHSGLFEPVIAEYMRRYPAVELDLDFSDRMVDVIGDGFDAVVRTGVLADSGLKRRRLGSFRRVLVGSPDYFAAHGRPQSPGELQSHICLHYRFPSTGRLEAWPLPPTQGDAPPELPQSLVCNSVEMRIHLALHGQGIACLPDFIAAPHLRAGRLQTVLDHCSGDSGTMWILWPASRDLSPKLRAFIDCLSARVLG